MKKTITILLLSILILSQFMVYAEAATQPKITGEAGILMDFTTGEVLYEKNAHKKLFPASTTKVLTALIILENHALDEKVVIDAEAPFEDGSKIYLIEGEVLTVEQLLYAAMVQSANDACVALANYHSGSVEEFAKVMTERALELGALNSTFKNPNGMPNEEHVSTAYDLALISKKAMEIPKFRELCKTVRYNIPPTNKQEEIRYLKNKNRFLSGTGSSNIMSYKGKNIEIKYDIVDGIKTGYTNAARQCFIGTGEKNGLRFISVVLKSEGRDIWLDTRTILDYGFDNYKRHTFTVSGNIVDRITLDNVKKSNITAVAKETLTQIVPIDMPLSEIAVEIKYKENFELPILENDKVGTVSYVMDGEVLASTDLISATTIEDTNLVSDITAFLVRTDGKNQLDFKFYLRLLFNVFISFLIWRTFMTLIRVNRKKKKI